MSEHESEVIPEPTRIYTYADIKDDFSHLQVGEAVAGFETITELDCFATSLVYASLAKLLQNPHGLDSQTESEDAPVITPLRVIGPAGISAHSNKPKYYRWTGKAPSEHLLGANFRGIMLNPQVALLGLTGDTEDNAPPSRVDIHLAADLHVAGSRREHLRGSQILTAIRSGRGRHKTTFLTQPDHTAPSVHKPQGASGLLSRSTDGFRIDPRNLSQGSLPWQKLSR